MNERILDVQILKKWRKKIQQVLLSNIYNFIIFQIGLKIVKKETTYGRNDTKDIYYSGSEIARELKYQVIIKHKKDPVYFAQCSMYKW